MVDGVTSSQSYAVLGLAPLDNTQSAPAPQQQQQQAQTAAAAAAHGPVPDFTSGMSATYVLDYRDPVTNQLLVQIPMRTALAQFTESSSTVKVGKTVDTEA